MKLVDLVVLPEKEKHVAILDYNIKEYRTTGDWMKFSSNKMIDQISQIEIPIAKILELVEVDVEKVEELFKKNISTYHYSEVLKFKKDLGSNKKDILKAVKS